MERMTNDCNHEAPPYPEPGTVIGRPWAAPPRIVPCIHCGTPLDRGDGPVLARDPSPTDPYGGRGELIFDLALDAAAERLANPKECACERCEEAVTDVRRELIAEGRRRAEAGDSWQDILKADSSATEGGDSAD